MRIPKAVLASLAAFALVAGCGDDDADQADPETSETTDETEEATGDGSLDDDVAAVVDGEEISVASIDEHIDALAENPRFSQQLEGPEGEAARDQLRAQILSTMIQTSIVSSGAEELDRPVTDEDLTAARAEVEDQAGGPEALQTAMEEQGLTESLLELDLRSLAALNNVEEALDEQAGDEGSDETAPEDTAPEGTTPGAQELSPSEQRVQEFLGEQLATTDVAVNPVLGQWNPQAGQVVPAGGAPGAGQGGG